MIGSDDLGLLIGVVNWELDTDCVQAVYDSGTWDFTNDYGVILIHVSQIMGFILLYLFFIISTFSKD